MADDLPPGWHQDSGAIVDMAGVEGRGRDFWFDRQRVWLRVKHFLAVYEDETAAQAAYALLATEWFPTSSYLTPPEASYSPHDTKDLYRISCIDGEINLELIRSCIALYQHGPYVSILIGSLKADALTFEQFERASQAVETRLSTP